MVRRSLPSSPDHQDDTRPIKIPKMDDSMDIEEAVTGTAPIPSYRPDAKARRYDRQLRLWASAGQRSLEQARILLVGCDAPGCQALKNLILPGIAHFTILSRAMTTAQDVATNFFLHPDSIGKPLAAEAVKYLDELNSAVEGVSSTEDPASLLQSNPSFFTSYTLIVCSNVPPQLELELAQILWQTSETGGAPDIPLISIRNSGFIGRIQIQLREHCVIDTHPDTTHTLRIDQPFPQLEKYARHLDMETMDSMDHSHIPYLVLLVRALCEWKDSHDGKGPTYDDKDDFKALLQRGRRKGDEENYDEAMSQAFKCWNASEVGSELQQLLDADSVKTVTADSKNLHILLHALKRYLKSHPLPPISPSLPDMHSSTSSYISLQNLFKQQYFADLVEYKIILADLLQEVGLPEDAVTEEEIESFVKNTEGVDIVKGTSMAESREGSRLTEALINDHLIEESEYQLAAAEHLALLASEDFFAAQGRWPGTSGQNDKDEAEVKEILAGVLKKYDQTSVPEVAEEAISEIVRGGFGTLPNTAAFIGGIVGQEAIKLVTGQYSPLDNTVIVDLIKSTTAAFKL